MAVLNVHACHVKTPFLTQVKFAAFRTTIYGFWSKMVPAQRQHTHFEKIKLRGTNGSCICGTWREVLILPTRRPATITAPPPHVRSIPAARQGLRTTSILQEGVARVFFNEELGWERGREEQTKNVIHAKDQSSSTHKNTQTPNTQELDTDTNRATTDPDTHGM
jgi:hypothetical protein